MKRHVRRTTKEQSPSTRTDSSDVFMSIFERHGNATYRYCLLMLGEKESAEDIYQDTLAALHTELLRGTEVKYPQSYLLTIARNRCLNHLKRDRRAMMSIDELNEEQIPTWYPDYDQRDEQQLLQTALQQLPEHYREVVLLCEIEGYSYKDAASVLALSEDSVRNTLYRSKIRLRALLAQCLDVENRNNSSETL